MRSAKNNKRDSECLTRCTKLDRSIFTKYNTENYILQKRPENFDICFSLIFNFGTHGPP